MTLIIMMNTSWLQPMNLEGKKAVIINGSINYRAQIKWLDNVWILKEENILWNCDTAQLQRCMKTRSFTGFQKILSLSVWLHGIVDASRLFCYISAAVFFFFGGNERRDNRVSVCCLTLSITPQSSVISHICFKNMWDVKPSSQPAQKTTSPETLPPSPSVGRDSNFTLSGQHVFGMRNKISW